MVYIDFEGGNWRTRFKTTRITGGGEESDDGDDPAKPALEAGLV